MLFVRGHHNSYHMHNFFSRNQNADKMVLKQVKTLVSGYLEQMKIKNIRFIIGESTMA